uniref:Uncharacterized protein n=1 Tax=Globodera rostochiensis TaxID=31243 RepID=A0A914HDF1_GLORO
MTSACTLLFQIWTLILTFHRLNGDGHIDLTIEQLTLRTAPPGESKIQIIPLRCRTTTASVRTFAVDASSGVVHQRRFDFTSAITPNVVVQLDIMSDSHQLLVATGFFSPLPTHNSPISPVFSFVNYGNIFMYRLKAMCSVGFVGPKCTETCEPPKPGAFSSLRRLYAKAKDSTAQNSGRKWPKYAHIHSSELSTKSSCPRAHNLLPSAPSNFCWSISGIRSIDKECRNPNVNEQNCSVSTPTSWTLQRQKKPEIGPSTDC